MLMSMRGSPEERNTKGIFRSRASGIGIQPEPEILLPPSQPISRHLFHIWANIDSISDEMVLTVHPLNPGSQRGIQLKMRQQGRQSPFNRPPPAQKEPSE